MSDRDRFERRPDDARRGSAADLGEVPLSDDALADPFLEWLGRELYRRNPGGLEEDARFMSWLSQDLRRRPPAPDDWDAVRVRRVRQRILERAWAERCGIADGDAELPSRDAPAMPLAQAVDEASGAGCAAWTSLAAAAGEGRELWDEQCERWLELPAMLAGGRHLALRVAGDSMTPLLHDGDTILVRLGHDVRPNSVIVAWRPESGYVVKRVGRVRRKEIELVSLNAAYAPITLRRDPATVLGTVVMRWCPHPEAVPLRR